VCAPKHPDAAGKQHGRGEFACTHRPIKIQGQTVITRTDYQADRVRTAEEREAVFAIRMRVFVEEQGVPPEEELDALDEVATHFLVRPALASPSAPESIIGTARLIDKGAGTGKVGRVAVVSEHRGRGAGTALMRVLEQEARARGWERLVLDAQVTAIPFYARLGYVAVGEIFLDAGIEHRLMTKERVRL
jgi:predicted GNAT family N-acyltransferase